MALARDGRLFDLSPLTLDELLALHVAEIWDRMEGLGQRPEPDPAAATLMAPVEGQEVWAAGVIGEPRCCTARRSGRSSRTPPRTCA